MRFARLAGQLPDQRFVLRHHSYFVNLDYVFYLRSRELSTGAYCL